ncbi:hypothetical protein M406DRAFT_75500 [Cryphonectria parasitica EP155]|uniref:Uncharacterized protein n=1 Tax=Cryphonectria parasitica (strain ATCC 38755 / EP155) TaxID=660469 RepID=A0A9P4Y776_CRYP1|nr:uncharacterized protein M406DRAFT_75500 [Cryphonectria parasitica EP155]KAF3768234.1 hypothetical protein M406DRAFT_75500 [Cryphonectria parasitica EP155]
MLKSYTVWLRIAKPPPKNTTDVNAKVSQNSFGLATPEATPAVEDGRIAADKERMAAAMRQLLEPSSSSSAETREQVTDAADNNANDEIDVEIKRIMHCFDSSYAEILGVNPNSPEKEVVAAWRHPGCMLHPKFVKHPNVEAVFKTRKMGLDDLNINEIMYWDGEEQFDASGPDTAMNENVILIPSQRMTNVYSEATPLFYRLGQDFSDPVLLEQLYRLNAKIMIANRAENIEENQWTIPGAAFFGSHYNEAGQRYEMLRNDPANEKRDSDATRSGIKNKAQAAAKASAAAVDAHALAKTYLQSITETKDKLEGLDDTTVARVEEAEQAIIAEVANALAAMEIAKASAEKASLASSMQDATEALEAAEAAYTTAAEATKAANLAMDEALSLVDAAESAANSSQSSIEYPWTTTLAADGSLIIGVRKQGATGTQILTTTSLSKVLGRSSAAAEIMRVCERDGIQPPSEAGWVSHYYDPSKVEKDPVRRRALRDSQAITPSDNHLGRQRQSPGAFSEAESRMVQQLQDKVENLENQMKDRVENLENQMKDMKDMTIKMDQNMAALMGMFKEFMRASATTS